MTSKQKHTVFAGKTQPKHIQTHMADGEKLGAASGRAGAVIVVTRGGGGQIAVLGRWCKN